MQGTRGRVFRHPSTNLGAKYRRGRATSGGRGEDEGSLDRASPSPSTVSKLVEQDPRHCRELKPDSWNGLDTQYVLADYQRWTTGRPHIEAPTPASRRSVGKRTRPEFRNYPQLASECQSDDQVEGHEVPRTVQAIITVCRSW
jgi:hypothetical protein